MEDFINALLPYLKEGVIASIEKEDWQSNDSAEGVLTLKDKVLRFSIEGGDDLGAWFNIT